MQVPWLGIVLWILGIRGEIPHFDGLGATRSEGVLRVGSGIGGLLRVLGVFILTVASLSAVLWTAVWLAIRFL